MRYWLITILLVIAALVGLRSRKPQAPNADPVAVKLKAESEARVKETIETLNAVPRTAETSARETLTVAYDFMAKSRRSIHRDSERKAILERLAKDEAAVKAAGTYLQDLALVREHFGERQAEARMFSIGLLRERAAQGDLRPLEETTKAIVEMLTTVDAGNKGRQRDLEDLVASYLSVESAVALQELGQIIDKLGYKPGVKQQFVAGIYFGLQSTHAKQEIIDRLEQIGISVGGRG